MQERQQSMAYCVEKFDRNLFRSTLMRVATDESFRKRLEDEPLQVLTAMGFQFQPEAVEFLQGKRLVELIAIVDLNGQRAVPIVVVEVVVVVGVSVGVSVATGTKVTSLEEERIISARTFAALDEAAAKAEALVSDTGLGRGY